MKSYLQATDLPFGLLLNFGVAELESELIRSFKERTAESE
jgi:hypothetical protein